METINANQETQKSSAAKPTSLKIQNRKIVMSVLRDGNLHSIIDIADKTGVSRQTVSKALDHFVSIGLLEVIGKGDSTDSGGKKPNLYQLSSHSKLLVVQMRVDEYYIKLFDLNGNELGMEILQTKDNMVHDFQYYLHGIRKMADDLFRQKKVDENTLYGVEIITPGPVVNNSFLHYNPFCREWGFDIPVKDYFQKIFPTAQYVFVENIGKSAGLGTITGKPELYRDKRVVTVYTSKGINGCLFDQGKMVNGANSIIGEFGHMILQPDSPVRCICGNHGCFESVVRSSSIQERIQKGPDIQPFLKYINKPLQEILFNDIQRGYEAGFECCRKEMRTLAEYFAQAFLNISLVCDPDMFVIEGYYSNFRSEFEKMMRDYLSDFSLLNPDRYFQIIADPEPLNELEVSGAITALTEHFFSDDSIYN